MTLDRNRTLVDIQRIRLGAIIRAKDQSVATDAMKAAVGGGFRMVEFTLNTPGALEMIGAFAADDRLIVGAGTVMSAADAQRAVDAGARFIVAPNFDIEVVATAR